MDHEDFIDLFRPLRDLLFVFTMLWFSLRFIKNMEIEHSRDQRSKKKRFDKTTVRAVCQISRVIAIMLAALVFLQTRNVNLSAVLAFGGAGGLIVGLAAKIYWETFWGFNDLFRPPFFSGRLDSILIEKLRVMLKILGGDSPESGPLQNDLFTSQMGSFQTSQLLTPLGCLIDK